jgi:DNA-binding XRE family transcriptional regulator/predicted RNase H-like HicB family nuclease
MEVAVEYFASVSKDGRSWLIEFRDAPGCQTCAGTKDEIAATAKEAIEGWLESWLVTGEAPPRPTGVAAEGLRVEIDAALAIAIEIRWARLEQGLTQAELAERAGVTQQQINRLEKPGQNPSIKTIVKVASALGMRSVVKLERRPSAPRARKARASQQKAA